MVHSLLLGLLSISVLIKSATGALTYPRLDEVPVSVLKDGCYPLVHQMCPALMGCFVDLKYPKFGQCVCQPTFSLKLRPPTPVKPGSEIANLPHKSDCLMIGPINFFLTLYQLFIVVVDFIVAFDAFSMIKILIQKRAFKGSSSCIALVALAFFGLCSGLRSLIHSLYHVGWDRNELLRSTIYNPIDAIAAASVTLMIFECCCTWFDLWQKSIKMSKRSSKAITVFRTFLRIYGLLNTAMFVFALYGLVPGNAQVVWKIAQNTGQYSLFVANAVIGPLLARVLCKNMKDITNPNWKAASAIRITAMHGAAVSIAFNISVQLIFKFGLFTNQAQHMNESFLTFMFLINAVNLWAWYQYLQFAHRRDLGNVANSRIRNYFGFATLSMIRSGNGA